MENQQKTNSQKPKNMKRILTLLSVLCFVVLLGGSAWAQSHQEKISRTASFQRLSNGSILYVQNINGSVRVEGYNGSQVLIEANKSVKAKRQADLDLGIREIQLGVEEAGDTVFVYLDAPFVHRKNRHHFQTNMNEVPYNFSLEIVVRVPQQASVRASTVNGGEVTVANTVGRVRANNVNGNVTLSNVAGQGEAHTVNGNIEASFTQVPTQDTEFKTINGNIRVKYPEKLSADLSFKTMHGDLYTDFPVAQMLPAQVTQNNAGKNGGTVYKINKSQAVRIGQGGPKLDFQLINGNIYVEKNK
jgi:DUF4097 and DUF4098 domain-containing protein YvlB